MNSGAPLTLFFELEEKKYKLITRYDEVLVCYLSLPTATNKAEMAKYIFSRSTRSIEPLNTRVRRTTPNSTSNIQILIPEYSAPVTGGMEARLLPIQNTILTIGPLRRS